MRRVISVWLPNWATDWLRRRQPDAPPGDTPLVISGHDGRRRTVAAADVAAQSLGLYVGMPLAHAQAMVPGLAIVPADPEGDLEALTGLAAWCLQWSPLTAADDPDGIWIDATGCAHLFGGETAMLHDLIDRLAARGITARAAIADTTGAAHAVARHGKAAVTIVPEGAHAEAIACLPVSALRLPPEIVASLRRLGFDRIFQIASAPRAPLAHRFGGDTMHRLDQATGRVVEPIVPVLPPQTIQQRRIFPEPLLTAEAFAAVTTRLVEAVCATLERSSQGARQLDLLFERVDGSMQAIRIGTARPSRDPAHLTRLLAERFEEVDPDLGVEAMRLVVPLCEPLRYRQIPTSLAEPGGDDIDIGVLVDRLENRLGRNRVYRAEPVESDVPERSVRHVPALAPRSGKTWPADLPRPPRLFATPQPVDAVSMLPDHPPAAFTWRRVRHRIRHANGPERIAGEWWRRDAEAQALRDYWQVEDEAGNRFWLYRSGDGINPDTGSLSWFLHGVF